MGKFTRRCEGSETPCDSAYVTTCRTLRAVKIVPRHCPFKNPYKQKRPGFPLRKAGAFQ